MALPAAVAADVVSSCYLGLRVLRTLLRLPYIDMNREATPEIIRPANFSRLGVVRASRQSATLPQEDGPSFLLDSSFWVAMAAQAPRTESQFSRQSPALVPSAPSGHFLLCCRMCWRTYRRLGFHKLDAG